VIDRKRIEIPVAREPKDQSEFLALADCMDRPLCAQTPLARGATCVRDELIAQAQVDEGVLAPHRFEDPKQPLLFSLPLHARLFRDRLTEVAHRSMERLPDCLHHAQTHVHALVFGEIVEQRDDSRRAGVLSLFR